jgi:hypothetical protein
MGKIRQIVYKWIDRMIEKSFQRQADKLFEKHNVLRLGEKNEN